MPRSRETLISLSDTPYYHCMARCVRRAFLFGSDSFSGRCYDHRKQWIVDKLSQLSEVFAIDVCAYAVMSNHYHVVLHVDASSAQSWSTDEVLLRWTRLFSGNALVSRYLNSLDSDEVWGEAEGERVLAYAQEWRARLMDISWFMRVLNESIARMANEEDDCKGRFWEGRFRSQALLDEAAVLACMMYVDLNPVRAGVASTPEGSEFTSIQARLEELAYRKAGRPKDDAGKHHKRGQIKQSTGAKQPLKLMPFNAGTELQAGEKALAFSLKDYSALIDWTGRAIRPQKKGAIREEAPPILKRLGFSEERWLALLPQVEDGFTHALGAKQKLQAFAKRFDMAWVRGQRLAGLVFG